MRLACLRGAGPRPGVQLEDVPFLWLSDTLPFSFSELRAFRILGDGAVTAPKSFLGFMFRKHPSPPSGHFVE